eukprot:3852813-Amphidinium_carterae.1
MAYLRFQLDSKQEPVQFPELPPPQAVPAMAATVGPPTTYAPANTTNPFVGCDVGPYPNPHCTLTGFPPVAMRRLLHLERSESNQNGPL